MASLNLSLGTKNRPVGKSSFQWKDISWIFDNTYVSDSKSILKEKIVYGFRELNDTESILAGIRNIFSWKKGERILLPEFGNPLYKYLYEPINDLNAKNICIDIRTAIETWEPRVALSNTTVVPDTDNNQYSISVSFHIPSLGSDASAVYQTILQIEEIN